MLKKYLKKKSYSKIQKYLPIIEESDSIDKITPSHLLGNPLNSTGSSVTLYGHLNLASIICTGQAKLQLASDRLNQVTWWIRWPYLWISTAGEYYIIIYLFRWFMGGGSVFINYQLPILFIIISTGRERPKLTWGEAIKKDLKEWDIPRDLCLNKSAWKTAIDVPEPWLRVLVGFQL